jgi:GT2 family glycosyltransferase
VTSAPRVLLAIAVYNGQRFIDRTLASAAHLDATGIRLDVLILDDASPGPGFSEHVEARCHELGFGYYRSPRNQGLVRNVNLGMLWAAHAGYDYVILANSDVIYPVNLATGMVQAAQTGEDVGAVVSWSNNMGAFTLPNHDPDTHLASQEVVDFVSTTLAGEFGDQTLEIPCGVGFCWMIPTPVIDRIGIHDTVFDKGYCEETDWTLRARAEGLRILLVPSVFTYHEGNASMLDAGVLRPGDITVDANEAIIDERYPDFRDQVQAFEDTGQLKAACDRAVQALSRAAAARQGYEVEVGWLSREAPVDSPPRCLVHPGEAAAHVELQYLGFHRWELFDDGDGPAAIRSYFGSDPLLVTIRDVGPQADRVERTFREAGVPVERRVAYPQAVVV